MEVATLSKRRGCINTTLNDTRTGSPVAVLSHRLSWKLKISPENQVALNAIYVQTPLVYKLGILTDIWLCNLLHKKYFQY